jgi:hypothetical protein
MAKGTVRAKLEFAELRHLLVAIVRIFPLCLRAARNGKENR